MRAHFTNKNRALLHIIISKEHFCRVTLDEAMEFLSIPQGWTDSHSTLKNDPACRAFAEPVLLASVSTESLACDVVGVWGAIDTQYLQNLARHWLR